MRSYAPDTRLPSRPGGRRVGARIFGALAWVLVGLAWTAPGQSLQDSFINRQTVKTLTGQIVQDNSGASVEANEPRHGGKTGGHSLWISWIAVTNGIVTFKTETSGFDTLLSAYQYTTANGSTFADLREVARADDSEGLERESSIQFGVVAGQQFEVAVDGYFGAVGEIDFQWEFRRLPLPPPLLLNTLTDRAANFGEAVSLVFSVANPEAGTYQWFRNGQELEDATAARLDIPSFSVTNVGRYTLRVEIGGGADYFSVPVEVQINSEGSANTLAQGKLLDAAATPLVGRPGNLLRAVQFASGVARGYNGSQIFNTAYAITDTNEPPHCGVSGGPSYWLLYQPPSHGTVTFDTLGSDYDNVMEIYTYTGALTNYQNLISLACAHDSFSSNHAARIVLPVIRGRPYLVVVQGVNGASGTAWLNYQLDSVPLPQRPTLSHSPPPQIVAAGSQVLLAAPVVGTPPLLFAWRRDGALLPDQIGAALLLLDVTNYSTGSYSFTVTNDLGGVSGTFALKVVTPVWCQLSPMPAGFLLSFATLSGQDYTVEEKASLLDPWVTWPGSFVGNGLTNYLNVPMGRGKFYRVRIE